MHFEIRIIPVYIRNIRSFEAANPWRGGRRSRWNVNTYGFVNLTLLGANVPWEEVAPGQAARVPAGTAGIKPNFLLGEYIGISSDLDSRYHLLPLALADLWQRNEVPDERLPELLKQIELQLRDGDFGLPGRTQLAMSMGYAALSLIGTLILFGALSTNLSLGFGLAAASIGSAGTMLGCRVAWRQRRNRLKSRLLRMAEGRGVGQVAG